MTQRIEHAKYRVADVKTSVTFYRALGMEVVRRTNKGQSTNGPQDRALLRFKGDTHGAGLELEGDQAVDRPQGRSSYWKIGVTVDDLEAECERLSRWNIKTSPPRRFSDVGYLCHLTDPDGFGVELLQRTFEPPNPGTSASAPRLSHITYRVGDIQQSLELFRDRLEMSLNGRVLVDEHEFELYFLSFEDDVAPCYVPGDIPVLRSREWLWQRPFTMIELWHSTATSRPLLELDKGFGGLFLRSSRAGTGRTEELLDPEGYPVVVSSSEAYQELGSRP